MGVHEVEVTTLEGESTTLGRWAGDVLLIVNVASRCGYTPQYAGLEALSEGLSERGLVVLGFPCNQFGGQEPGSAEQIATFCSTTYGVTFPMMEKIEVNGPGRHRLYDLLTAHPDTEGVAGDVAWNFEKFVVGRDGEVLARFRSATAPDDPALIDALQRALGN